MSWKVEQFGYTTQMGTFTIIDEEVDNQLNKKIVTLDDKPGVNFDYIKDDSVFAKNLNFSATLKSTNFQVMR